jgi:phytoene dehydrogenase-like protein
VAQVELQNPNVSASAQLAFSQSVVELTQRTESLNFLRESMYRMCEQAIDGNLSSAQIKDLYDTALKTSLALAEADLAKQQNQLAQRLQDPEVRAMWKQLIENGGSADNTQPSSSTGSQPSAPLPPTGPATVKH